MNGAQLNIAQYAALLGAAEAEYEKVRTVQSLWVLQDLQQQTLWVIKEIISELSWRFDHQPWVNHASTQIEHEGAYIVCSTFFTRNVWLGRVRLLTAAADSILLLEEQVLCHSYLRRVVDACLVEAAWQNMLFTGRA